MLYLLVTGRVGNDAEVKQFANDRAVINFNVAHTERWKNAAGVKQERTYWVKCAYWKTHAQAANMAQYIKKGMLVSCKGLPDASAYSDQQGKLQASLELTVDHMNLESGKNDTAPAQQTQQTQQTQPASQPAAAPKQSLNVAPDPSFPTIPPPTEEDDLPF